MDVGYPSNFARLMDLYESDLKRISKDIRGAHFTDDETSQAIRDVFFSRNYLLDPHGAIGYLGLKDYLISNPPCNGIFLETAHPGKFKDVVENSIGQSIPLPEGLTKFLIGEKKSVQMSNSFEDFRSYLMKL